MTKAKDITKKIKGRPVEDFEMEFEWYEAWEKIFDEQVKLLKGDIARNRAEGRIIIYLSVPISTRGGGHFVTNVDIAKSAQELLLSRWGQGYWILNPAQYQLESKEGTGLIMGHIERLNALRKSEEKPIDLDELKNNAPPGGGDYMRMWTKVLAENPDKSFPSLGLSFDALYFLGPSDVHAFFSRGGAITITAGIEEYFARKYTMDGDFHDQYIWLEGSNPSRKFEDSTLKRKEFFRYYGIRAGANYSLGCHDEWNIFQLLNKKRLEYFTTSSSPNGGDAGELLAGYFDGKQLNPGMMRRTSYGYERK